MSAESGDRATFLARLRDRAVRDGGAGLAAGPHPPPPPNHRAPTIGFRALDPVDGTPPDLYDVFVATATNQEASVRRLSGRSYSTAWLEEVVAAHEIRTAVVSDEIEARDTGALLEALGVTVSEAFDPRQVAEADLGVTSATAAIATTGSVVLDCSVAGSRTVSLLPRVHLCVLPIQRLAATTADVLRTLGQPGHDLPSNLVLVSGPSRTGDIEQLLTLGVHGPVALYVAFTDHEVGAGS